MADKNSILMYKGKPLVRKDNTIYYGFVDQGCVVMMQILSTKELNGVELADKVLVQLLSMDEKLSMRDRILKKAERRGLYNALDIGSIWLERSLNKPAQN